MIETLLFIFCLMLTGSLLFLLVYFVITLSDLECDYLNAQQCCSRLNVWVIPKLIVQAFITVLLLINGHWILFILNFPLTAWLIFEHIAIPPGNTGVYDPTEIHNRGQLKKHMRDCMIYLASYLIFFFIYLYCMIISMLKDSPFPKPRDDYVEF